MKCFWSSMQSQVKTVYNRLKYSKKRVNVTGIVLTKLDGTAKGGIAIATIAKELEYR